MKARLYYLSCAQGAIIAQVAISAISLTGLENSHWTAEAFFVISLVTGCLSVFFSCAISPAFHGLHSAEDIKDFLTKPTPSVNTRKFNLAVSQLRKHKDQLNEFSEDEINILRELVERGRWKVASAYAAIMLVVPMTLLKVALNAFLIGLGIYLGKMYTANLIPSYGFGSIGVLVFYLVSALFGIGMYYVTQSLKYLESSPLERWRMILDDHKKNGRRNQQMGDAPNEIGNDVRLPSPGHFRQSRHVREGNTIHFVTDETVGSTVDRNEPRLVERPRNSTEDESLRLTKEQASPNPRLTSDIANSNEAAASPGLDLGNMKDILKELIRVQEESFRVNQRLLDVLNME